MDQMQAGTWVEIEQVILNPKQRAPSLPEDTRKVPYVMRVSGFLLEPAELGRGVHIRTIIGRRIERSAENGQPQLQPQLRQHGS